MTSPIRPTRAEIDLAAVVENARRLAALAGGAAVHAVVKADAYGHGAVAVARALSAAGVVGGFAVSLVEEGVELRDAGLAEPILVMGPALDGGHDELVGRDMTALVSDPADAERLAASGRRRGIAVSIHVKIDTGMGRLGILPGEIDALLARCRHDGITVAGLATHLACVDTDDPDDPGSMTRAQLARFAEVAARAGAGAQRPVLHAANSAATLRFPTSRLDWVRPGLALYGNGFRGFRQAMRLRTEVAQLRSVPAGTTVSYGALWRAERPTRLAILPIGYADGLPRGASARAEALIGGRRCPIVGAICMDMAVADVTLLGDAVSVGDAVILLGEQGSERISAGEFGERAGLIEYEVTCGISRRVPRIHR